ncbi:MAG: 30S ribosomal protein S16 [Candidatus Portnoybacteria bacterium]|nr:30S ribosomal protein S16 [Candidatus Portnoybacteria bacterium]
MVKLRLIRVGRRNDPHFRIVAQDVQKAPKGRYLELLGFWSPIQKERKLEKDKILGWLSKGAKPTDTVWNMLVREGVVKGKKVAVHAKPKIKEKAENVDPVRSPAV